MIVWLSFVAVALEIGREAISFVLATIRLRQEPLNCQNLQVTEGYLRACQPF